MSNKEVAKEARNMIAQFCATRREELGISQEELAEIVGVKRITIWRWENGKFPPSFDMVLEIMRALDLYIFTSEKEKKDKSWSNLMSERWTSKNSKN